MAEILKKIWNPNARAGAFLALALAFITFNALNNVLFGGARLDLTENSLYTLSEGSKRVIDKLDEQLDLYFFFSDKGSRENAQLRNYARRVRELLEEYAHHGKDKINLQIIDPEPFSVAEDRASEFGLEAAQVTQGQPSVYFGLAGSNSFGKTESIPFFLPENEQILEYEISRLIHDLTQLKRSSLGVVSSIDLRAQTSRGIPDQWAAFNQMRQLFDFNYIDIDESQIIPPDIDVLLVFHPAALSGDMQYAIDQYVLSGKPALIFVDPISDVARASQGQVAHKSELNRLLRKWGVEFMEDMALADGKRALQVDLNGQPGRHLGFIGLISDDINDEDVVTSGFNKINLGLPGAFKILDSDDLRGADDGEADGALAIDVLLQSSDYATLLPANQLMSIAGADDLQRLMQRFTATGERYPIGLRITGPVESAFDAPEQWRNEEQKEAAKTRGDPEHIGEGNAHVILFSDTDMLGDSFWVRTGRLFGQTIMSSFADNGSLVMNSVDSLAGGADLISVRSRGRSTRPFEIVADLRRNAEEKYAKTAEQLERSLRDTEQRLNDLQAQRRESGTLDMGPIAQTLEEFQAKKRDIRRQLREVRHSLNRDISNLGTWLKVINIIVAPLLLTLMLYLVWLWRQASTRHRAREV